MESTTTTVAPQNAPPPLQGETWQEAVLSVLERTRRSVNFLARRYQLRRDERDEVEAEAMFRLCLAVRKARAAGRAVICTLFVALDALYRYFAFRRRRGLSLDGPLPNFLEDPRCRRGRKPPGAVEDYHTDDELQRMAELHAGGMTLAEVGEALGYPREYVRRRLKEARRGFLDSGQERGPSRYWVFTEHPRAMLEVLESETTPYVEQPRTPRQIRAQERARRELERQGAL